MWIGGGRGGGGAISPPLLDAYLSMRPSSACRSVLPSSCRSSARHRRPPLEFRRWPVRWFWKRRRMDRRSSISSSFAVAASSCARERARERSALSSCLAFSTFFATRAELLGALCAAVLGYRPSASWSPCSDSRRRWQSAWWCSCGRRRGRRTARTAQLAAAGGRAAARPAPAHPVLGSPRTLLGTSRLYPTAAPVAAAAHGAHRETTARAHGPPSQCLCRKSAPSPRRSAAA